jgi:prefoldin subunit 5
MGKVNAEVMAKHMGAFVEHLDEFKKDVDVEKFKGGISAIRDALKEHGHDHILNFLRKAAEHINAAVKAIEKGIEVVAVGIEHLNEILTHVRDTAQEVHADLQVIDPAAAQKLDGTMKVIDRLHKKVNQADKTMDKVEEVMNAVKGGAAADDDETPEPLDTVTVSEEKIAAEDTDAPRVEIDAMPEVNAGGDVLPSPEAKEDEELKDLPMSVDPEDFASNSAVDGEDLEAEVATPQAEVKEPDLGDEFVGEGGDMPAVEAPVEEVEAPEVPAVDALPPAEEVEAPELDLGDEFVGEGGDMPAVEAPVVDVAGDTSDLASSSMV